MKSFNISFVTIATLCLFAKPIKSELIYPTAYTILNSVPTIYRTYALAYPYYSPPLLFSYSQYEVPSTPTADAPAGVQGSITPAFVKHHQPDHKGDDGTNDGNGSEVGSGTDANRENSSNNNNNVDGGMEGHRNILKLVYPLRIISPFALPMPSDASQYHAQDAFGQYQYGYSNPLSAKNEIKTADGITRGSYSYIDSNGQLQTVSYIADPLNGFRVAATNLPVAPQAVQIPDAPDVAAAKEELFRLQDTARNTLSEESLAEPNIE